MLHTLAEMADRLAEIDGRDRAKVFSQLRNPNVTALLCPEARSGVSVYAPREIFRARIALRIIDMGLSGDAVRSALAAVDDALKVVGYPYLEHPPSAKVDGGYHYGRALDNAIRGARAGEPWVLALEAWTDNARKSREAVARVFWMGSHDPKVEAWFRGEIAPLQGRVFLGETHLPLTPLLTPLLPFLEDAAA